MSIDLKDKVVLVTGASSMIGKAICESLKKRGAIVPQASSQYYNLLSYADTQQLFVDSKPEYVIHAAGYNGNIQMNLRVPADIFYRTSKMALNVLQCCPEFDIKKVLSIISSCALPDVNAEEPLKAENLWEGLPNNTVECHGLSKRILHAFSRQLNKQFKLNAVCAILTNCYGPNDSYDVDKTKVVGGLIKKFTEAKKNNLPEVVCWGAGKAKRELMYCYDAGEALVQTLERYEDVSTPLCLGTGSDISILELTELIVKIVEYEGKVVWDTSKTEGQMRKILETSKMKELLDVPITNIEDGLRTTIGWYNAKS